MADGVELLERLLEHRLVDRDLVGDPHPLGALEALVLEYVLIDRRRVVDDDHDLRLRVHVGPRLDGELVELVDVADVCHSAVFIP